MDDLTDTDDLSPRARVMAVANTYDAMTSARPYREGFPPEQARVIPRSGAGSQWDANLVDAFLAMLDQEQAAPRA